MEKDDEVRQPDDKVPGLGYWRICPWKECPRKGEGFFSFQKKTRFCSTECRIKWHNSQRKSKKRSNELDSFFKNHNEKILGPIYSQHGNQKLTVELLKGHLFMNDCRFTPVRSGKTKRPGKLYVKFVLYRTEDGRFFQIFTKEEFKLA